MNTQIEFYVSPNGNDNNPGTIEAPFATLERARNAARSATNRKTDLFIYLRQGRYELTKTLLLESTDSLEAGCLTFAAYPGENVVLSGGRMENQWELLQETPSDLPEVARGKVWVTNVNKGESFYVLFDQEGMLTRARSQKLKTEDKLTKDPKREFYFKPGDMANWSDLKESEIVITPNHAWTLNILGIESVDEEKCIARTNCVSTYNLVTRPIKLPKLELFYCIENRLAYLNGPGQWALDSAAGKLYLWPRTDQPEGIIIPRLQEIILASGNFEKREWVKNIRFEGITFSHCDRHTWRSDRRSLQHDWEQEDTANAMLRMRGVECIEIKHCRFINSGNGGVRFDLHAVDNKIIHNEFTDLGATGIGLIGYGPGLRDENHHNIIGHNHIYNTSRLHMSCSGIFITQSGHNKIHDNLIHHLPYCGVVVSGPRSRIFDREHPKPMEGVRTLRWDDLGELSLDWWAHIGWKHSRFNLIENNEIHNLVETLGDGNGIYLSGSGEGNIVRRNYVHDLSGEGVNAAIRNDDQQYFTLVEDNVVWKINACGIISKNINMVENNIIVDCYGIKYAFYLSIRHMGPSNGSGMRRNLLVRPLQSVSPEQPKYAFLEQHKLLLDAAVDDNLFWCASQPEEAEEELQAHRENNKCHQNIVADPLFMDAKNGDFRLKPDSPAFKIGFRPFDSWGFRGQVGPQRQCQ